MKKNHYILLSILILIQSQICFSQTLGSPPKIDHSLPKIEPPSPTVAALMRFEEVPVSNYTGIPDISIPIYSIGSYSKDISVDISLKYHPSGIAVEELASVTGLGWSLFAGGTISRTVRGYPDELYNAQSLGYGSAKVGIYRNDVGINDSNYFYEVQSNLGANLTPAQILTNNKFHWYGFEKGKFDTEHDLYQFNFMGHTGRFIIKKNGTNSYEVVRLDNDNAIHVQYYHGENPSFIVHDDKGYKFVFDVRETTQQYTSQLSTLQDGTSSSSVSSASMNYISSYHLSSIFKGNVSLVTFAYNSDLISEEMQENTKSYTTTYNYNPTTTQLAGHINLSYCEGHIGKMDPYKITSISSRNVNTKKIQKIEVNGKSKIYFTYEGGRQDTNLGSNPFRLKQITIKNWNNTTLKAFDLNHTYSTIGSRTRMMLQKVTERDSSAVLSQSYGLAYAPKFIGNLSKDYWGYYTIQNGWSTSEPHPFACKTDVLQKMVLPTGGAIVFGFESNTYSYIGADAVTDFSDNYDYWIYDSQSKIFQTNGSYSTYQNLKFSTQVQIVKFTPTLNVPNVSMKLYKLINGNYVDGVNITCGDNDGNCTTQELTLTGGVHYALRMEPFTINQFTSSQINISYKERSSQSRQFLFGGGLRIKNIGHFENSNVAANYYDGLPLGQDLPLRQKNYKYNFFDNPSRSSGSLAFGKPLFTHESGGQVHVVCYSGGFIYIDLIKDYTNTTYTNFNNLLPSRTQGADVGYQNVTVSEIGNGYSQYTYRSPIDYPEDPSTYVNAYPFRAGKNLDYLRGQAALEKHFNEDGVPVYKVTNSYSMPEDSYPMEIKTGFRLIGVSCPYSVDHQSYENYINPGSGLVSWTCGPPVNYIGRMELNEAFGWTRLLSKKTEHFYYDNGNPYIVEQNESFTYNFLNKKLESHSTTNSQNETFRTNYFYHLGSTYNVSEIERIENYKNNVLLSTNKIEYSTFTNNQNLLPFKIKTSKGFQSMETRIIFNDYDVFGNVLEVQQENGTKISYIWGYNKTQPVAKIENMAYASIPTSLITAIQGATSDATLQIALTALRTHASLANSMVTTYTYLPLIGISTVTDPKGYKTTYSYDNFGRLSSVKDADGKLLSTNSYNYRP